MILLIIATALVVVGATLATLTLGLGRLTDTATAWCVLVPGQIVVVGYLAGIVLRSLNPATLTLTALVLAVAEAAVALRRRSVVRASTGRAATGLRAGAAVAVRRPLVLVMGVGVLAVYAWRLAIAVRIPPTDWDGLGYHLVAVDTWVQNGAVTHVPYTTGELIWSDVYPQNSELASAWSAAFLHNIRLAGLTPFVFAVLGAVAVAGIARNLGAARRVAVLVGLAFALTPIVVVQLGTGYVDVMAATTVLAGFQLVLSAYRTDRWGELCAAFGVAGVAFGLAAGTKTTNLLATALGVVVAAAVAVGVRRRLTGTGRLLTSLVPAMACVLVPVVALAAFWYSRTWLAYGNPVYPYAVLGFPGWGSVHDLLVAQTPSSLSSQGAVEQVLNSWFHDLHPPDPAYKYDQRVGGFGPQWPLLLLPATVIAAVWAVRRDRVVLLGLVLPFVVMLVVSPVAWWSRFTLFVVGLGAVCFALVVAWAERLWFTRIACGALVTAVGVGAYWSVDHDSIATDKTKAADIGQTWDLLKTSYSTLERTVSPYNGYGALDDLPDGSVIGVPNQAHPSFTHPYIGSHLERRLVMFDLPDSTEALDALMVRDHVGYVVLSQKLPATAPLAARAAADPAQFRIIGQVRDGLLLQVIGVTPR